MKQPSAKPKTKNARRRKGKTVAVALCIAAALIALGATMLLKRPPPDSNVAERFVPRPRGQLTFNKDIAPILFRHCAGCHRPGEAAPFSLLTYQQVKARTNDIVKVTARRYMPPWLPEHGGPALADERRLTEDEIGVIRQWTEEGAAEGAARDLPPLPQWTEGWQLGTPDLVAEMPAAYMLPAEGRDVYRNFVIPLSLPTRRFVRAVEFKPNSKVFHHIFVRFDRSRQSRRLDEQDAEAGFGGMALPPNAESPGGHFLSWQPGRGPTRSPNGLAWPLEPNSDLILQAHLQPSGKPETVRPSIGFYFTDQAPTNTAFKIVLGSIDIDIPAGTRNYEIQDSYVLPVDAQVLAVLPHAHYLAKEMHATAVLPSGATHSLLNIKEWDFNWQSDYRYLEPIHLPKGTRIGMRYTYDNSSQNVRNPQQPPVRVRYGAQTTDEMGELWLQLLARNPEELRVLQADFDRRLVQEILAFNALTIRQSPTNAHAHVQYGKALMVLGRREEALPHFRRAVQIDPDQEEGHYHIGVLLMDSDLASAEKAFVETVRVNPENFKARNNLGLVLMSLSRDTEAEAQFRAALELNPGDRRILENLNLLQKRRGRP